MADMTTGCQNGCKLCLGTTLPCSCVCHCEACKASKYGPCREHRRYPTCPRCKKLLEDCGCEYPDAVAALYEKRAEVLGVEIHPSQPETVVPVGVKEMGPISYEVEFVPIPCKNCGKPHLEYTECWKTEEKINSPAHYMGEDPDHEHWKCMVGSGLDRDAFLYNSTKYMWRVGKKRGAPALEDLRKAEWYLKRRIEQEEQRQNEEENHD